MNPQPVLIVNRNLPVEDIAGAGVAYEGILAPKVYTSGNPANAYECLNDAIGWIALSFDPLGVTTAQANQLVIGWSTLAGDTLAVKAAVNAQIARIGAGVDGAVVQNLRSVQLDPYKFPVEISANPYTTIKTVYAALALTGPAGFYLSVSGTKPS